MKLKFFGFLFLISHLCFSQADGTIASKLEKYKDTNLDSLLHHSKEARLSRDACHQLLGDNGEAYYYYKLEKYDKVIPLIEKTIVKSYALPKEKQNDLCIIRVIIGAYNRLFWTYKNLGKYQKAYEQLITSSKYINSITNSDFDSFNSIVNIDFSKAQIKKELGLFQDAKFILLGIKERLEIKLKGDLENIERNRLLKNKANVLNLLGKTYMALNRKTQDLKLLDSAAISFKKAFKSAQLFTPPHPDSELMYALRKTEVLIAKQDYNQALKLINSYFKISKGRDIHYYESLNKAICFHNLNKTDSAIYFSHKLLKSPVLKKSTLISIYDILSNQYLNKNQLDSAYIYSKLTLEEFNSARENKQKTYQLLYDNDIEKITELNNSILKKEKSKNLTTLIFYSIILLSISSLFLFKRKKYKKEISIKSDELKEKIVSEKLQIQQPSIQQQKSKVNYNIEIELEEKILARIEDIEKSHDYLDHNFSINSIAESLNTNSTYISFVFNKHHDQTFKQYYTKKKIEYAVELLKKDRAYRKFSIEGLAKEVGYNSASAFTRAFKKHIKITPSEFIKNLKK
ncbi:AraC family transcriptional regulator [Tenacibaculum sp. 190524A05c]|uniref:HTH araC/xylS-type domain-containing protein n=1 Tax=Tenacibaculum platacis TaxID=3137852 RepID=A0ABM9P5C5_9FLAO